MRARPYHAVAGLQRGQLVDEALRIPFRGHQCPGGFQSHAHELSEQRPVLGVQSFLDVCGHLARNRIQLERGVLSPGQTGKQQHKSVAHPRPPWSNCGGFYIGPVPFGLRDAGHQGRRRAKQASPNQGLRLIFGAARCRGSGRRSGPGYESLAPRELMPGRRSMPAEPFYCLAMISSLILS